GRVSATIWAKCLRDLRKGAPGARGAKMLPCPSPHAPAKTRRRFAPAQSAELEDALVAGDLRRRSHTPHPRRLSHVPQPVGERPGADGASIWTLRIRLITLGAPPDAAPGQRRAARRLRLLCPRARRGPRRPGGVPAAGGAAVAGAAVDVPPVRRRRDAALHDGRPRL